ncbi:MAG: HPr-rel-A system PqqD family peptide chaperone [Actinobacteria bacterium]|nr:HPr-rel-A system PqqD family peptide chaperone [Actinomycetota bacterium]
MKLTLARPARKPDVWVNLARGENTLFDPDTGKVHLLNDTALAIWDLCDGETYPAEMLDAICELCNMQPEVVSQDLERVLGEFQRAGLIEWVP